MPDTPTEEGSIVAYLRLDDSDWKAKLDEAKASAEELRRIDPTIRVRADTADAEAKLLAVRDAAATVGGGTTVTTVNETVNRTLSSGGAQRAASADAVAAAENRMAAAMTRARMAAQAEEVAAMRLDDVQGRRRHTALQVASAELSLARAEARSLKAQQDAIAAGEALNAARAGGGDITGSRAGSSSGGRNGRGLTMLQGALVSLIPVMGPLAGYVAGVTGAFLGMGSAGVFAVLGIKREMADGSIQGQKYADLMSTLQGDLHGLEDTAASGILQPFSQMVAQIDSNMPSLNREIGGFAHQLGDIGVTVVGTLVSGFQTLNPLFNTGAQYIQHLATEWAGWVNGGGLNQFAADATQWLPLVAADLGNLASIAMRLIVGMAPLGTVVLQALQAVSGVIASMPVPVLVGVASAAAAVYLEMRAWSALQPIVTSLRRAIGLLGIEEDAALGPIGLVIGAVAALGLGVASAAFSTQQASTATQDYTVALQQSNGVIDDNIRKTAAKNLQDQGVLDTARKYGISLQTVTDAALGNAQAQDQVNAVLDQHRVVFHQATGYANAYLDVQSPLTSAAKKLSGAVNDQSKSFNDAVKSYQNIADASGTATSAQDLMASQASQVSAALAIQAGFATGLSNDLKLLNGISLDNVQSATAQAAAINSVSQSFKTNGNAIDGTTKAAVANQQALEQAVSAIDAHGQAVATATGSQDKGTAAIEEGRNALLRQLAAQHELTPAVQRFIDTILKIPTERNVNIAVNTVNAVNAVTSFSTFLSKLQSKTIDLNVVEHTYGVGISGASPYGFTPSSAPLPNLNIFRKGSSVGGTVGGSGSSGVDTVPMMLAPGEEVISNMRGQASRYRALLKAVNANAGPSTVAALAGAGSVTHVHNWYVTSANPEGLMQYMTAQTNRLAKA